ncbi:PrgI family protein [Clostridioides difficile]|nr:PrgI family protein [Clostridioides difficile]MCI4282028.1 PrgI family protein [Clostridioides difficile]MCP3358851.1 PrgI family protein [Clostridioides difficile]MDS6199994.1 PrgI family protein [Clostridioides difficile]HBF8218537.1 PrgI family protein [Clostridioides difficile]
MEVKINKEIRNYTESMFFGLSMRQFLFSVLACGVAVGLFFLLRGRFGTETLSWMCVLGASPFAVMGFVRYNGMTAEQFVWAWIKSEFLMPKRVLFLPDNLYYEALKQSIEAHEKGTLAVQKKRKKKKRRAKRRKEARKRRKQAVKARKKNEKSRKRKEADYD